MSIFGKIMNAIFGSSEAKAESGAAAAAGGGAATAAPMSQVDVEKVVSEMASKKKEKLDWRKSIVDLMKVLDLDSSLGARKELAKELGYTGDMNDSAKMNIWLHKQVMNKLAANGGKVPADLRD
jgi:dihydroorotase-like cyclic amidohydrolase